MKPNTIILIIATIIVSIGAYWYFFANQSNEAPLTVTDGQMSTEAEFQSLVQQLQPISFDTKIFSDSRFMSLVDITTPITPETQGRLDPFSPLVGVGTR